MLNIQTAGGFYHPRFCLNFGRIGFPVAGGYYPSLSQNTVSQNLVEIPAKAWYNVIENIFQKSTLFLSFFEKIYRKFGVPPEERAYVIKFYLTGVFAIAMEWLNNDCNDSMDFIIKIINDCVPSERSING